MCYQNGRYYSAHNLQVESSIDLRSVQQVLRYAISTMSRQPGDLSGSSNERDIASSTSAMANVSDSDASSGTLPEMRLNDLVGKGEYPSVRGIKETLRGDAAAGRASMSNQSAMPSSAPDVGSDGNTSQS